MKLLRQRLATGLGFVFSFSLLAASWAGSLTNSPASDTTIGEDSPDSPLGTDPVIKSGTTGPTVGNLSRRGLLKFDLSSVPTNAVVTSAALILKVVQRPVTQTNLWFDLRKVFRAWSESAATWTNRLSPPAPWSASGAAAPVDYCPSVTQSNLILGNDVGTYTFSSNLGMIADVQAWVRDPGENFGWILICELQGLSQSTRHFGSREDPVNTPALVVQFTLPATPPALTLLPVTNGNFRFSFNAESNRTYAVEFTGGVPATNWSVLTNIPTLPAPANVVVASPFTTTNRLHRVRTP
jgi:hypothetical protein